MSTPKSELLKLGKRLGYTIEQGGHHVVLTHPTTGARVPVHNGSKLSTSMAHKIKGQLHRGTNHQPTKDNRQ